MTIFSDDRIPERLEMLDSYLAESESRVSGIREDCEKKIVWHDDKRHQRDLAIVYIHGFSASRMEIWPLCDHLAAAMGANLFYTRLTGHGRDGYAMATAKVRDWQNDGMEAMAIGRRLGRKIILVGTSTGGTLAVWLAAQPSVSAMIHRLILLSPNFFPKNPVAAAALWPPALRLFESFFGGWRSFSVVNARHAKFWTVRYPVKAIATMMQLVRLSWRLDLGNATMPVLMMVNPWDRVINVTLAIMRYLTFASPHKRLVLFRGNKDLGRHVLAGDILTPETTARVMTIIQAFLNGRS
ncbi:alpha/beta fold hydrolase [uncultured Desulfosarcina sp.]|uniref:alpha/beta hydrolase n=1 Tax=uncultured Desulfosarcina sp. TaxID=218289 RepID=UPI0029C60397|nr:alpha/beta fold hydrolase [uncultured Desulfosarcina sp.]